MGDDEEPGHLFAGRPRTRALGLARQGVTRDATRGQQRDIEKTVENLRSMSESLKEAVDNSKKYPSQLLFGAPPPPSKVMGK